MLLAVLRIFWKLCRNYASFSKLCFLPSKLCYLVFKQKNTTCKWYVLCIFFSKGLYDSLISLLRFFSSSPCLRRAFWPKPKGSLQASQTSLPFRRQKLEIVWLAHKDISFFVWGFLFEVPLSLCFLLVGFNKRSREIEGLCAPLSAAELSELKLEALDDEDAILDLRAQSAHDRAVRGGLETKKHHTDHRQPRAKS